MSRLVGYRVDDGFRLFPPVYTDFGKNIKIGKDVFVNSGAASKTKAASRSATAVSSGTTSSLRRSTTTSAPEGEGT